MTEPDTLRVIGWSRWLALLLWACTSVLAQEGPYVPCVGCESLTQAPYPETGSWYNPEQSGSGINLEIQNGYLVGFYYGYDAEGLPDWHMIIGPLVRSEREGVQWELDTDLQHFDGGNCLNCPYQPPDDPVHGLSIELEFLQRSYLRVSIDGQALQYFVPLMYGTAGKAFFSEQTPFLLPDFHHWVERYSGYWTPFMLVFRTTEDPSNVWRWESALVHLTPATVIPGDNPSQRKVQYRVDALLPEAEVYSYGLIECALEEAPGQPGCTFTIYDEEPLVFHIPVGQFSDSRFFGEAEDGWTVEGIRLFYD